MYRFECDYYLVLVMRQAHDYSKCVGLYRHLIRDFQNIESVVVAASHGRVVSHVQAQLLLGSIIEVSYAILCYSEPRCDDLGFLLSFQLLNAFNQMRKDLGLEIIAFPDKVQTAHYSVSFARGI